MRPETISSGNVEPVLSAKMLSIFFLKSALSRLSFWALFKFRVIENSSEIVKSVPAAAFNMLKSCMNRAVS